jgi:hypothetical protein
MAKGKGKRKAAKAAKVAAPGEITPELANPENFVDGLGYRAKCVLEGCDVVTDGGAVIRATGERYALCPDHRTAEGLVEALSGVVAALEEPEGGDGGGGDGDANDPSDEAGDDQQQSQG